MLEILKSDTLLLASKSPRRKDLLEGAHIPFTLVKAEWEEDFDSNMNVYDVPQYLSYHKATSIKGQIKDHQIVLTADTVVIQDDRIIGKPADRDDAIKTIKNLSHAAHEVVTGITLMSKTKTINASCLSLVDFMHLSSEEIDWYVDNYEPFDKAGSYGIQDWIGISKIHSIQGSYHNIMGLPVHMVYDILRVW